ncbi:MAG: phosphatidylglycerol lysyltransferase domain-containing protein [Candidatus Omnitrophota bacterium]
MSIPSYPLFEPLKKEHKSLFDNAFENYPPEISEFTFTNLYSWRIAYDFQISMLGDLIILKASSGTRHRFLSPIGQGDIKQAIVKILDDSKGAFIRISESAKDLFSNDPGFIVDLDRNNSDYLYRTIDLISLQGRRYDGKRNLIKKFRGEYEYRFLEFNASNISRCLEFEEKWCSIKDCDSVEGLNNERNAIKEMVSNFSEFNLIAGAVEIKNAILALAIAERFNLNTLVMHVLKADPNMPGLYQVIMNEFLEKSSGAFEYVNLEQDLGIEGLRKSKKSYHPVKMINKYTISLKE